MQEAMRSDTIIFRKISYLTIFGQAIRGLKYLRVGLDGRRTECLWAETPSRHIV